MEKLLICEHFLQHTCILSRHNIVQLTGRFEHCDNFVTGSCLFLLLIILDFYYNYCIICIIIVIIFRINVEINNISIVFNEFYCQFLYSIQFLVLIFSTKKNASTGKAWRDDICQMSIKWVIPISRTSKSKLNIISGFGLSHHWGDNVSGSQIAQSVEYSPCKRGVPGSSTGLTAHFSHPVTFGAQWGNVHASLVI